MVKIKNTWQKMLKQVDIDLLMVEIKNTWQKTLKQVGIK